jgi:hypothetical protein
VSISLSTPFKFVITVLKGDRPVLIDVYLHLHSRYYAFGGKGYATATYEVLICEAPDSEIPPLESVEIESFKNEEFQKMNEDLKNEMTMKNEEIKNLTTEVLLLRERLLEKIYLISELHTKLNECEN